jgi:drug/metabolite transporter (DMT)-like permease
MSNPNLWLGGGVAGMVGICCYILAIAVPWPETQLGISASLVVVSAWPILSIIYSYALYGFVSPRREKAWRTDSASCLPSRRSPRCWR